MYIKSVGVIFTVLFTTILLFGCAKQQDTPGNNTTSIISDSSGSSNGKELSIVTTFPPLYAHVANLIDGNDSVTNLVPPGASVHFWQPKPSDVIAMEEADIIIINGLGLEEFLEDYLSDLETKGIYVVDTSIGVELLEFEEAGHDEHEEAGHDAHTHEGSDPHIWLDPKNADIQLWNIVDALIAVDPSQEKFYNEKAWEYADTLVDLDSSLSQGFADQVTQPFVVFHDAYQYFLNAYNLTDAQVGLVQEFHGDTPSPKQIADLIEVIQQQGVQTIFTEPQFNPRIVERLEQETGVSSKEIDPIGTELSKDGYTSMMETLAKAFSDQ